MSAKPAKLKIFSHLLLAAFTAALLICAALFVGWLIAFVIMGIIGKSLLVGMYYLAWPIVFPLFALPAVFLLLLGLIPLFKQPFPEILGHGPFLFGILLPMFLIAMALMLATCPLDAGGTLLSRGGQAFG